MRSASPSRWLLRALWIAVWILGGFAVYLESRLLMWLTVIAACASVGAIYIDARHADPEPSVRGDEE